VFFAAVLLLSLGHFFVYSYLLNTMQREEDSLSRERMGSAIAEMSNCFDDTKAAYVDVLGIEKLKTYNGTEQDMYSLSQIQHSAAKTLDRVGYIHSWFIMLEGFDKLISKNGIITPESYFDNLCRSDTYGNAFWQARLQDTQGKHFFPADAYCSRQNNGNKVNLMLMPLTVSPGGHADVMIVLLLDMRMMCQTADAYMQSGIYFFDEDAEALITFSVEKNRNIVELTVHGAGTWFRAKESTSDMLASIDAAVGTIEGQIRKNKTRLARRLKQDAFVRSVEETSFVPEMEEEYLSIVRIKQFPIKPMRREEAVLQMNLLEHNFFAFRDEDNGGAFAVVYKRNDGGYGLIEDVE
jgi:putative sigma-54 modulation protein